MKQSRIVTMVLIAMFVGVCLVALDWVWAQPAVKPTKLKGAGVFPPPEVSMMSEIMKTWQDEVTKRTKGAITFENFWGGALGAPAEHIDLLKKGTVQIALTPEWFNP